jgi:hypothetical protein
MPTTVTPTDEDRLVFGACMAIQQMITSQIGTGSEPEQPRVASSIRSGMPNALWVRTGRGILVQYLYHLPVGLITPWGNWEIMGECSGVTPTVVERMFDGLVLEHYTLAQLQPGSDIEERGALDSVLVVNQSVLPRPVLDERPFDLSGEQCHQLWATMHAEWQLATPEAVTW